MSASILSPQRSLPPGLGVVIWLTAFLSPTGYFMLILLAGKFGVLSLPPMLVVSLFVLMPVVGLIICEWLVWRGSKTLGGRIGGMVFTFVGMALQVVVLLVIVRMILVVAISYAQ